MRPTSPLLSPRTLAGRRRRAAEAPMDMRSQQPPPQSERPLSACVVSAAPQWGRKRGHGNHRKQTCRAS